MNSNGNQYELFLDETIYTEFKPALDEILIPHPGKLDDFVTHLQSKLSTEMNQAAPDAPTLTDVISR